MARPRNSPSRRDFLRTLGTGTAGLAAAFALPSLYPRRVEAEDPWGEYPQSLSSAMIPKVKQSKNVLELFLWGGVCPWESFYVVDETDWGQQSGLFWWTFQDGPPGSPTVQQAYDQCTGSSNPLVMPFRADDGGTHVKLGPFVEPLRQRDDIIQRLRLQVVQHDVPVHNLALPLALTGYRFGSPKMASVGAAVQHFYQSHSAVEVTEPFAYSILPYGRGTDGIATALEAVGGHPSYARPLTIHVGQGLDLIAALQRRSVPTAGGVRDNADALTNYYTQRMRRRLTSHDTGQALRSDTLDSFQFSFESMRDADKLVAVFTNAPNPPQVDMVCNQHQDNSQIRQQLQLAAYLLRRPNSQAKYVQVLDNGYDREGLDFGFDSHRKHVHYASTNLTATLRELVAIINDPAQKENDPLKIDLDETLVVINTEFGRTPGLQGIDGRNHFTNAYVTAMFGGSVNTGQQGISGYIGLHGSGDDLTAVAKQPGGPAETRAAILAALGIYPFTPEGYAISQVLGVGTAEDAAHKIKEQVLGIVGG